MSKNSCFFLPHSSYRGKFRVSSLSIIGAMITYSRVHPLIYEHLITPFDLGAQWLAPIYERIFGALIEIYAPGPNGTHTILKRPEKERYCRHRWTKISPINIWRLNLPYSTVMRFSYTRIKTHEKIFLITVVFKQGKPGKTRPCIFSRGQGCILAFNARELMSLPDCKESKLKWVWDG